MDFYESINRFGRIVTSNKNILQLMRENYRLSSLAEGWLYNLCEESKYDELVKNILDQSHRNSDLSFGPLFKNERTYFDLNPRTSQLEGHVNVPREISEFLLSKGYEVDDYQQGLAKSKENPNRKMKIGRLLKGSKYQKDFNERLKGMQKSIDKYKIVFSYKPEDIALMSTGRRWTSCANLEKGGPAADQLPQKISAGGMVAYLIQADDKDIEDPVARISIRRFVSLTDGSFILLPEQRCYGADSIDFVTKVEYILDKSNEQTSQETLGIFKDAEGGYSDTFRGVVNKEGGGVALGELALDFIVGHKWEESESVLEVMRTVYDESDLSMSNFIDDGNGMDLDDMRRAIDIAIEFNQEQLLDLLLYFVRHGEDYYIKRMSLGDEINWETFYDNPNEDLYLELLDINLNPPAEFYRDLMDYAVHGFTDNSKVKPTKNDGYDKILSHAMERLDFKDILTELEDDEDTDEILINYGRHLKEKYGNDNYTYKMFIDYVDDRLQQFIKSDTMEYDFDDGQGNTT